MRLLPFPLSPSRRAASRGRSLPRAAATFAAILTLPTDRASMVP